VASLRHEVIADNIANVDTPKFKRKEVIFEDNIKKVLQKNENYVKLKTDDSRHMQIPAVDPNVAAEPEVEIMQDLSYRNDENNVDIDLESAKLKKNDIQYNAEAECMSNEIKLLRMAITGRE